MNTGRMVQIPGNHEKNKNWRIAVFLIVGIMR